MISPSAMGNVIRRIRKERHLSQDILSGLSGTARSHLSAIEHGKKQINLDTLFRIADALGIPAHFLVSEAEAESKKI